MAHAAVVLKLHRAEVGIASLLALGAAGLAAFLSTPSSPLSSIEGYLWSTLGVLPFALGLVAGVPIVSRELEGRTAQIAWSLSGSRLRWLLRQGLPILLVVGTAVAATAVASTALVGRPDQHPEAPFVKIGSYGLALVARTFAAFGLGVLVGALVGRAIPALVLGTLLCVSISAAAGSARDAWFAGAGPRVPIEGLAGHIQTGWAIVTPDGRQLSIEEAVTLAPDGVGPEAWLEENGYVWLAIGIPMDVATSWNWYDSAIFVIVGSVSAAAAALVIDRKRPG